MAKFKIHAGTPERGDDVEIFFYDNQTSELTHGDGTPVELVSSGQAWPNKPVHAVSRETPGWKRDIRTLKISLGLSCNYECGYCSQRYVPRAEETTQALVEPFVASMPSWFGEGDGAGTKIEFWGGEPFVYWKTMKPLAESIKARYPETLLTVITNGSLLTDDKAQWLIEMGFSMAISHDGPGQHHRGPDPLADPETRRVILSLYKKLAPLGKMSFNTMFHRGNTSRAAVKKYFQDLTGEEHPHLGEGGLIDAYDQDGLTQSLRGDDHLKWRIQALNELRDGLAANAWTTAGAIRQFVGSVANRRPANALGQKCGMDDPTKIAVDLHGNVVTCQNVSIEGAAGNGESHKIGHVSDLASVRLNTATHWSKRKECSNCPVLQLCKGSCMFLGDDALWEASCNNAFSDHIVNFAIGFEAMTGMIPVYIEGPHRRDRWDIFGAKGEKTAKPTRRIIPIMVAA